MKLLINEEIKVRDKKQNIFSFIEKFLTSNHKSLGELTSIEVQNTGEGFTTTRVRVTIANALAYALGIPIKPTTGKTLKKQGIEMVEPLYSQPPNITTKK